MLERPLSLPVFALFGALLLCPGTPRAAPGLDAYVLTAGGNSLLGATGNPFGCATFGPDAGAARFGRTFELALPTDGSICGVGSDGRSANGIAPPVQVAATLAVGFGTPSDPRTFTGNAKSRADYGSLGVQAVGSYTGASDSFTVAGTQAGARQVDTLNFGGASGNGTYRATFTIDGSLFNVGRTDSEIEFGYAYGGGPSRLTFRIINSNSSGISLYANGGYQSTLPGMVVSGSAALGYTVAGTTSFGFDIPIVFGVSQEVSFSLWAATIPRSNVNLLTASAGDASFFSSATLTGMQLFDSSGAALSSFTVTSGSGTLYGPGGVIAVPESGTALMLGVGLLVMTRLRTLRNRSA